MEGILPLLGGQGFAGEDVVGDGQDAQGLLAQPLGRPVQARRLHLHRQDAELAVGPGGLAVVVVELVGGEHLAHVRPDAHLLRRGHGIPQHPIVRGGAELAGESVLVGKVGVGGRAHGDDHIPHLYVVADAAGGADADDGLHTVEVIQLISVQADGGHTHAVAHDGDLLALVGAGVAQHVADGVEADRVFQIMLRHILCPQGIAGHQHDLGNVGLLRRDAGRGGFFDRHFRFLLVYFLLDFTFCCRIMPSNSRYTAPGRYLSP